MSGSATILHADLDAFYASVEQRDEPSLRGRPVIVGGGVVLAASYEARARGVRTAMGGRQARQLCPEAVVIQPRFEAYTAASRAVFAVFEGTTPLVEALSIDEAFLDVAGLARIAGSPAGIAARLRTRVQDEVGLAITVGVARTKFLAKVASGVAKPNGLLVVPPEGEFDFLHPLAVERLWGVGEKTAVKLRERGIFTVGEVAAVEPEALIAMLGRASGRHLHALAHNRDPRPIELGRRRRAIGAQRALGSRAKAADEVDNALTGLVERICRRLRKAERVGRTIILRLRFDDFTRATRSHTMPVPTDQTGAVLEAARNLLAAAAPLIRTAGITLVGVSITNLTSPAILQLELPFLGRDLSRLDGTVDSIQAKYGSSAVNRAVLLGHDPNLTVPMLPD